MEIGRTDLLATATFISRMVLASAGHNVYGSINPPRECAMASRYALWPIVSTEELFMAVMAAKMPLYVLMLASRVARAASFEAGDRGHGAGKCSPVGFLISSADRRWHELSAVLFHHDRVVFSSANALDPELYVIAARSERAKSQLLDA